LQSKGFPFKVPMLCHRTAFGFKVSLSLPSKGLCHPRAFAIKVPLPLASKGLFLEANSPHIMCIKLHRCNILLPTYCIESLVMQHPPTQPYQDDSSDC
jgi:hypothetical protein